MNMLLSFTIRVIFYFFITESSFNQIKKWVNNLVTKLSHKSKTIYVVTDIKNRIYTNFTFTISPWSGFVRYCLTQNLRQVLNSPHVNLCWLSSLCFSFLKKLLLHLFVWFYFCCLFLFQKDFCIANNTFSDHRKVLQTAIKTNNWKKNEPGGDWIFSKRKLWRCVSEYNKYQIKPRNYCKISNN